MPAPNKSTKFAQVYTYDTVMSLIISVFLYAEGGGGVVDYDIVDSLTNMLNSCNVLVKQL